MKKLLFLLICSASMLQAQTLLEFYGGINSRTSTLSLDSPNTYAQSWKSAISGSFGIDYFLAKSLAISSNVEYNYYPFDSYQFDGPHIPEVWITSSSGEATQIYRISLDGKLFAKSSGRLNIYFVTGAGYTLEQIGQIRLTGSNLNGPNTYSTISNQTNYYWVHNLGAGVRYFISPNIGIDVTGKWYSNYSTRFHESLLLGIVYQLSAAG